MKIDETLQDSNLKFLETSSRQKLILDIATTSTATKDELTTLIHDAWARENNQYLQDDYLFTMADNIRKQHYGKKVYFRGLIEFTNYCKNNCYYCGIGASNNKVQRYRLTSQDILDCCDEGARLGFKTVVLQGGEDPYFTDERLLPIIEAIRLRHPNIAITLSAGERSYTSYQRLYDAGANRYLLRHETATDSHYAMLHPSSMSLSHRKECLYMLKAIGYEVGAGFMVSSPNQTVENLADDLLFLKELNPQMVGIGPFIPHKDTLFAKEIAGTIYQTITMLALTRLLLPTALLPATTALGAIDPLGREKALAAGANVVMPNLSPTNVREHYALYDGKICTGDEAAKCRVCIEKRIQVAGYEPDFSIGNSINWQGKTASVV